LLSGDHAGDSKRGGKIVIVARARDRTNTNHEHEHPKVDNKYGDRNS
jgi:hypothetical protein